MSEFITCPVCESPNAPDATNCEVCGERLAPLAPGEEVDPSESVAAMIAETPPAPEPQEAPAAQGGFSMDDEDDYLPEQNPTSPPVEVEPPAPEEAAPEEHTTETAPSTPTVLYSPLTGDAYPEGTPEFAEGYGPMGEQLVATPPVTEHAPATDPEEANAFADDEPTAFGDVEDIVSQDNPATEEVPFEAPAHEEAYAEPAPVEEPAAAPEPAPSPFQPSGPNPNAPLPVPGTYSEPATLTLYYQRQPVNTYAVEMDELLIGRRDIRADIHPDIDLTEFDPEAFISRKHAYVYRQNRNYTIYAVSNGGVQLNNDLLELGDKRPLKDGDVIVLAGILAFKFKLPA